MADRAEVSNERAQLDGALAYIHILEAQLAEAQQMRDFFHEREQKACKEIERLAPLARDCYRLRFDLCRVLDQRETAIEHVAHFERMREDYAALIGVARDNEWEGVSEGMHAYAWDAFLQSDVGRADQRTRWAKLWRQAARKYFRGRNDSNNRD